MKFFLLFLLLFVQSAIAGNTTTRVVQADYLEGINAEKNFIQNGSFESGVLRWTITNGSGSTTSTTPFGSVARVVTASSQASQIDSDTGAGSALAGQNCLASVWVKTSLTNVSACAIVDGTLDTNLCLSVSPSNTFANYQIPVVCGATSTKVRVYMTSSGTGAFTVDNARVGVNQNISSVQQAYIKGSIRYGFNASCQQSITQTTYASDFPADTDCPTPTVTGEISAPSTKIPAAASTWQIGDYEFDVNTEFSGGSLGMLITCRVLLGSTASDDFLILTRGVNTQYEDTKTILKMRMKLDSVQTGEARFQCKSSTGTVTISTAGGGDAQFLMTVKYFPPLSNVVSTSNQDYGPVAYTPSIVGFGTPSSVNFEHWREGAFLVIRGTFTVGTPTATEARIPLPTGLSLPSTLPTIQYLGDYGNSDASTVYGGSLLAEPSATYLTMGYKGSGTNVLSKANGNAIAVAGNIISFQVRVPIQGWTSNNVIVGSFAGVPQINNLQQRIKYFYIDTGYNNACTSSPCTLSVNEGGVVSSVTRNSTGNYTVNLVGCSTRPRITGLAMGADAGLGRPNAVPTTTTIGFETLNFAFASTDGNFFLSGYCY